MQCPRVNELAARVDVRHRQLVDLQRRGWLGVRRGGADDSIRPSHEHRQGRYLGEGAQKTPNALVHLVEIGALGQRPLGGLLISRAGVQASFAARLGSGTGTGSGLGTGGGPERSRVRMLGGDRSGSRALATW